MTPNKSLNKGSVRAFVGCHEQNFLNNGQIIITGFEEGSKIFS
jgi:hypothetical protein